MLHKETYFRFNRFYLLFSLVASLVIPLLSISINATNVDAGMTYLLQTVQVKPENIIPYENSMSWMFYAGLIYFTVLLTLFIRFLARFISILLIRRNCIIEKKGRHYIALCKKPLAPFSFLNTIFISSQSNDNGQFDKIIMHESVHVRQLHSIDVIFSELICMLIWFNPIGWKIKAALKETHEYLADAAVKEQTSALAEYVLLLINNVVGVQLGLANNFNKSLTIKRINMMKKPRSGWASMLKALPVFPLALMLIMAFSCTFNIAELKSQNNSASQKNKKTQIVAEKQPEYPGGQEAMNKFILSNIKYPEAAKKSGKEGKVYVSFVVTKTGKLDKLKVTHKVDPLLDAEALRVVKSMPNWIAGKNKGANVDAQMTLPISFKLK